MAMCMAFSIHKNVLLETFLLGLNIQGPYSKKNNGY